MSDPHEDDFCVVCGRGPREGVMMHPVRGIKRGYVCQECIEVDAQMSTIHVTEKTQEGLRRLLGHPSTAGSDYHEFLREAVLTGISNLPDSIREDLIDIERELREEASWNDVPLRFLDEDEEYRSRFDDGDDN